MKKYFLFLLIPYSLFLTPCCFSQTINTIAGGGSVLGDGGPATSAKLVNPIGVIVDASGNLFIGDYGANRVRMVSTSGTITTIAGTGTGGYNGDGIAASTAEINGPGGLGVDDSGNVYITELIGARVRKVDMRTGLISTVAGTGTPGFSGDGTQATAAQVSFPTDVKFDTKGNYYITDESTERIRKIHTGGIITTIGGDGTGSFSGDGGAATLAELQFPTGGCIDTMGNVYIGDQGNDRVRIIDTSKIINTYAGNGTQGYSGDGGTATSAELNHPEEVVVDAMKNLFIDDEGNNAIRMVNASGVISTVAGNGIAGFSGDGGPATSAEISGPQGVAIDNSGNIYIADYGNSRVRKVTGMLTSLNQIVTENNVIIYPNPAKDELTVALNGIRDKVSISVYNIFGQQVWKRENIIPDKIQINTESIGANGIFILKIQKEDGSTIIRKFEVSR